MLTSIDMLHEVFELNSTQEVDSAKDPRAINKQEPKSIIKQIKNLKPQLPSMANNNPANS